MTALKYQVGKAIFPTLKEAQIAHRLTSAEIKKIYLPIDSAMRYPQSYYQKVNEHYFRNLRGKA